MSQETNVQAQEKQQVSVTAIKTDLINGLSRAEIAAKYGMPKAVLNRMFKHPALAGNRPKKASAFVLVDDSGEALDYPKPKAVAKKATEETTEGAEGVEAPATEAGVSESTGI